MPTNISVQVRGMKAEKPWPVNSSSNAMDIVTGAAGHLTTDMAKEIFTAILKRLDAIIHMEPNNQSMLHNRERLKNLAQDISAAFRNSEDTVHYGILEYYFGRIISLIKRADSLILAQSQLCISNIGIPRQIPELAAEIEKLLNDFSSDLAIAENSRRVMMPLQTPPLPLLQPIPDGGFVGMAKTTLTLNRI